jgi:hypothetical protein
MYHPLGAQRSYFTGVRCSKRAGLGATGTVTRRMSIKVSDTRLGLTQEEGENYVVIFR